MLDLIDGYSLFCQPAVLGLLWFSVVVLMLLRSSTAVQGSRGTVLMAHGSTRTTLIDRGRNSWLESDIVFRPFGECADGTGGRSDDIFTELLYLLAA